MKGVEDDEILEETGFSGIILPALDRTGLGPILDDEPSQIAEIKENGGARRLT